MRTIYDVGLKIKEKKMDEEEMEIERIGALKERKGSPSNSCMYDYKKNNNNSRKWSGVDGCMEQETEKSPTSFIYLCLSLAQEELLSIIRIIKLLREGPCKN